MEIKRVQPSFGMAIKAKNPESVEEFIFKNFSAKNNMQYRYLQTVTEDCPIDINLSVVKKFGKKRLQAEVGPQTFVSGFFKSPIRTIKQAIKYARKIEQENTLG